MSASVVLEGWRNTSLDAMSQPGTLTLPLPMVRFIANQTWTGRVSVMLPPPADWTHSGLAHAEEHTDTTHRKFTVLCPPLKIGGAFGPH